MICKANFNSNFPLVRPPCNSVPYSFTSVVKPRSFTEYGTEFHGGYAYIYESISTHEKIVVRSLIYFVFFFRPTNTEATLTWKKLDGHHR